MRLLVVDADLLALERIRSQAEKSGHEVRIATTARLAAALTADQIDLVVIDLDRGGEDVIDALVEARAAGEMPDRVVGFYSHVAPERAERAEGAGCKAVPRGRFYRTLDELLG
ncbi:MAG: hypothetical protein GEU71_06420 [Actinobacteria bacterium]|nr:hypothetical protein [Actinomycetota bacterium]